MIRIEEGDALVSCRGKCLRLRINESVFSIDLEMDKRIHEINDDVAAHRTEKHVILVATAHHTLASGAHYSAGISPAPLINADDKGCEKLATEVHLHVCKIGKLLKRTETIDAWHRGERPILVGDGLLDIERHHFGERIPYRIAHRIRRRRRQVNNTALFEALELRERYSARVHRLDHDAIARRRIGDSKLEVLDFDDL